LKQEEEKRGMYPVIEIQDIAEECYLKYN